MRYSLKDFSTLDYVNVKGKRVILRVDLNSSLFKGKVKESKRFSAHAQTIKELKQKGAKIVVLSHQGRKGSEDFTDLKQHAKLLNKYVKVKFVPDVMGNKAFKEIIKLKNGEALLLDNVRKLSDDFNLNKKNQLVMFLASVCDLFVQDAFSIVHRDQASITSLAKVMPSYVGRVLESELNAFSKMAAPKKPIIYLLGGKKFEDYASLIRKARKDKAIILGNGKIRAKGIIDPIDYLNKNKLDIGEKTVKKYSEQIKKAKTIFMKGSFGFIEDKKYQSGTVNLLKAIARNKKAFSLIGGGSLSTLIKELRINTRKFSYISLSGGALLKYLSGEKLPGLEALRKKE